jgi:hypothetical protein
MVIEQRYRDEFTQLGKRPVLRHIDAALLDTEKQKQAYEWLDEQEAAPDRTYKAKVFWVRILNACVSVLALIISFVALLKK